MSVQSSSQTLKEKGMSYRGRLLARIGFIAAFVLILCLGIPSAYIWFTLSQKTGNFWSDNFPMILALGISGTALFAIVKFRHAWYSPISFKPSYGPIAANRLRETFDVWYQESNQASPFGRGTILFQENDVALEGHLFRGTLYSLLSSVQGEKVSAKVPYSNITSASVKGRYIIFKVKTAVMLMPQAKIAFYVSEMDRERMYKELKHHFPTLLENK